MYTPTQLCVYTHQIFYSTGQPCSVKVTQRKYVKFCRSHELHCAISISVQILCRKQPQTICK